MKLLMFILLTSSLLLGATEKDEEDTSRIIDTLFYMDVIKIKDMENKNIEILDNGNVIRYYLNGEEHTIIITNDIKKSIQESIDEIDKEHKKDR